MTWIVARKFQFQCFNYLNANGKGTLDQSKCLKCVPATAFLVADHLAQLIVEDGLPREGSIPASSLSWPCWMKLKAAIGSNTALRLSGDFGPPKNATDGFSAGAPLTCQAIRLGRTCHCMLPCRHS